MSDKPPLNQHAELSVICSVIKHPECFSAFDELSPADFTQSTFGQIFAVMRELASDGRVITPATVNWDPPEEQIAKYGHDWEVEWASLVAVIKEGRLREGIARELGLDWEKCAAMTTPTLVLEASKRVKAAEAEAGKWKSWVEKYVPTLGQKTITWEALATEDDILAQQGSTLDYVVDEIIPKHRVTMLFGQEKSGKSIIALDLCKHVANGALWLNRKTAKTPCLYLDLEDGIVGAYIAWLKGVGEEKIRFITIRSENGIPQLDDPGLLALCAEIQPLIVLDSLHKLFSRNKEGRYGSAWQSSDYEPVLEKIRQLCVAGATVILIHHSTKSNDEQYRDSSAIGANVDFMFAVVGDEPADGVKRIHLIGKPSRGAQPPTLHILAFPHIIEQGHLCVDSGLESQEEAALRAMKEVEANGPAESKRALLKRIKGRGESKLEAINTAIEQGWLKVSESGEINIGSKPLFAPGNGRETLKSGASGNAWGNGNDNAPF
jgi:archaellum biogenesis ATPase FlaH